MTDSEICKLAYELELKFNPYCGYQDPYGCGMGGFKRMEFFRDGSIKYEYLPTELFEKYDMHLVFTGVTRNSKKILKELSCNIEKIKPLLDNLNSAYDHINQSNYDDFLSELNNAWTQKKKTSSSIVENDQVSFIDNSLEMCHNVIAHKLCGAGNGGFFLTFSKKNSLTIPFDKVKINVISTGVTGESI